MGAFLTLSISASVILLVIHGGLCVDIIGGAEVEPHSRPFMALISDANGKHICGGALIKENWVLTAAHCAMTGAAAEPDLTQALSTACLGPVNHWTLQTSEKCIDLSCPHPNREIDGTYYKDIIGPESCHINIRKRGKVILGAHSQRAEEKEKQVLWIAKQIPYPCYSSSRKENDIMLLQLQKRARLNKAVQLIPLPTSDDDPKPGTTCTVAGWGQIHNKARKPSDTLREVNITIISRQICNDNKHYKNKPPITDNMICAGAKNGGKDSCSGDSGGPLRCNNVMRGITAFGKSNKCGAVDSPGVYTRLTKQYLQWIRKTIGGAE